MSKLTGTMTILALIALGGAITTVTASEPNERRRGADDDNEADDLEIEIVAPVQAIDVDARTITLLGVTITVSATGDDDGPNHHRGGDDDGANHRRRGEDDIDVLPTLTVGQFVKVEFFSDAQPLTAREVKTVDAYEQAIKIEGSLQAFDSAANTMTILGLVIDTSAAGMLGADDHGTDHVTVTSANLVVGQNVEVRLDQTKLPALVAASVEVKNFTNAVELEFHDRHGGRINQFDDDVTIVATQVVKTRDDSGKLRKSEVEFHSTTRTGNVVIPGLAPGKAKVSITSAGKTVRKMVKVGSNANLLTPIKLKN